MPENVELQVQGNENAIAEFEAVLAKQGVEFETGEVNGLDGSPDFWLLVAKIAGTTIGAMTPLVLGILHNSKIKSVKANGVELRDVSEKDAERLLKSLQK
jgi:hypothetical protein